MRRVVAYPALVVLGSLALGCLGFVAPAVALFSIAFGWAYFLGRVLPGVTVDWGGVALGVGCLALFAALTHSFCRWVDRQVRWPEEPRWRPRWTASMVSGVVLMFAAGISAAGIAHQVGWLLVMKEPWFDTGSMAADRSVSVNNLKQAWLGLSNYQSTEGTMPPPATLDAEGRLLHGWQARVLPYIDQITLYNQINFSVPWDDPRNGPATRTRVRAYLNPRLRYAPDDPGTPAPSHYAGNAWVLGGDSPRRMEAIPDGAGQTILAGEAAGEFRPWAHPANWRDPGQGINRSPQGFGGPFPGGADFLFADGSVRFVKDRVAPGVFRALGTPDGGERVGADDY